MKPVFKILAKLNRMVMPSYKNKDLTRLSTLDKGLIAYRYWVTRNALG